MIILEGPDGAGKSTLAEQLGAGSKILHCGPKLNTFRQFQALIHDHPIGVWDRSFYSELVYGPVCRGRSGLDLLDLAYLELECAARGGRVIWLTQPAETLMTRRPNFYKQINVDILRDSYEQVKAQSRLYTRTYLNPGPHLKPQGKRWPHRGVGGGNVVLLGDQLHRPEFGPGHPAWDRAPLVHLRPFDGSHSGYYLIRALLTLDRYSPHNVYLTNATKVWSTRSDDALAAELNAVGPRLVVVLGNNAERVARRVWHGAVKKVPHPQHRSRFHFHQLAKYAKLLEEAIYG